MQTGNNHSESSFGKVNQIRLKVLLATLGSLFLFALVGLPNSPYSIIAGLRGKNESREQILIPTERLASALAVNNCSKEFQQSVYASAEDFKVANSGFLHLRAD